MNNKIYCDDCGEPVYDKLCTNCESDLHAYYDCLHEGCEITQEFQNGLVMNIYRDKEGLKNEHII